MSTLPQLPSSLYPLHRPSPPSLLHVQVDVIYVFAFVWSFGCNLDDGSRAKFNDFVSALLSPLIPDEVRGHDLFGFYVDPHSLALVPWAKQMNKFQYDPKVCMCVRRGGGGQWACLYIWVLMMRGEFWLGVCSRRCGAGAVLQLARWISFGVGGGQC
jgi:hypothetical protein